MFEYKIQKSYSSPIEQERLNPLGNEGWELVNVLYTNVNGFIYYFKRPKIK